jgi:hypothetical protein
MYDEKISGIRNKIITFIFAKIKCFTCTNLPALRCVLVGIILCTVIVNFCYFN